MRPRPDPGTMKPMTTPLAAQRVVLVPSAHRRTPGSSVRQIRRYRLARVQLEGRDGEGRFGHLKRVYD